MQILPACYFKLIPKFGSAHQGISETISQAISTTFLALIQVQLKNLYSLKKKIPTNPFFKIFFWHFDEQLQPLSKKTTTKS